MNPKHLSRYQLLFIQMSKHTRLFCLILVMIMLPSVYFLVYHTGGVKNVFSHTMYFAILFSGITLGMSWGTVTGIVAGILLGPLMPLDTAAMIPQMFFNWFFRLIVFAFIGAASGFGADGFRKNIKTIMMLLSHNPDTDIPNINYEYMIPTPGIGKATLAISIFVNNYDNLLSVLGPILYNRMLKTIYSNLKDVLPKEAQILQSDSYKLLVAMPFADYFLDIQKVKNVISKPLTIDDIPMYVEFTLGAVMSKTGDSLSLETVMNADSAARFALKNNLPYAIYDEKHSFRHSDFSLLGEFPKALETGQLFLVYQPKFDLKTGKPVSLEALIRWQHPKRGLIAPNLFIPLISETQMIHQMTYWVLHQVLEKIKAFRENGIDIPISMNISPKDLMKSGFYEEVMRAVQEADVSPETLGFEVVETELMRNPEECRNVLRKLMKQGFTIFIDDFGKGYSSLTYLSEYPFSVVKIDQYFAKHLSEQPVQNIAEAIIHLVHKLGYRSVMEGIEDESALELAKEFGSDYAQGYLLQKPIRDTEIIGWFKRQK